MDKKAITEIVSFLRERLVRRGISLKGIAIFGSQLTGEAREGSDVDLIVVSDDFERKSILERGDLTMEAEIAAIRTFKVPLDVLKMTQSEYESALAGLRFIAQMV